MNENQNAAISNNGKAQIQDDQYLNKKIDEIKENSLSKISPMILIKPAIFSFIVLVGSMFIDLSNVPILGNVTIGIAKQLYPNWEPVAQTVEPIQFWWLPILSYIFFISIAFKEYKGLFSHVRNTTPRENIDRIISSSMSLIDGYATALPLVGAAFLLVSIKLGPEIFLGLSVPFEIKALIVLAIAKLFEPVLDYIGVKFQKVLNEASDYQEQFYQKLQVKQTEKLIQAVMQNKSSSDQMPENNMNIDQMRAFREELEKIKALSFETYQNFNVLNKLANQLNVNLENNEKHLSVVNQLSQSIDSMAANLANEKVTESLNSLEHIVNRR
ncbi:MAG: hypothetical protein KDC90_02410 [Ignavibacteriae bacterium]|nr:hypothetical protein [Ignavibacteriota bacterium]